MALAAIHIDHDDHDTHDDDYDNHDADKDGDLCYNKAHQRKNWIKWGKLPNPGIFLPNLLALKSLSNTTSQGRRSLEL